MINYFPIILRSTESNRSIWLETRSSIIESGEEHLNLHIHCNTGTMNTGKRNNGFYEGAEEGTSQTIFRMPVLRSAIEKMVKDINSKVEQVLDNSDSLNFKFSFLYENQSQILIQILKPGSKSNFSFQIGYIKKEFESNFQIQTSSENIQVFMGELDEKIKQYR